MNNHERNRSIKGFSSNIVRSTTSRNTPIIWEFFLWILLTILET